MEDERRLASLVLLLRLPLDADAAPAGGGDGNSDDGTGRSRRRRRHPIARALEGNDCELLCFAGRLVRNYAVASSSRGDGGSEEPAAAHAFLRLATRVLFLGYASPSGPAAGGISGRQDCVDEVSEGSDRVCEYEVAILESLLDVLRARSRREVSEVDVEIAWLAQSLFARLSSGNVASEKHETIGSSKSLSQMWCDAISILLERRKGAKSASVARRDADDAQRHENNTEEGLMVKTIHSILDGSDSSPGQSDGDSDWSAQYEVAIASCVQSFLHAHSGDAQTSSTGEKNEPMPRCARSALFELIHWSQENDALSVDVHGLVLRYLRLCMLALSDVDGSSLQRRGRMRSFYHSCCAEFDKGAASAKEFAVAVRSFLFYGLVVLGSAANALESGAGVSPTSTRGDIYLLFVDSWRLFGNDWLLVPTEEDAPTPSGWWWFQSEGKKDGARRLGPVWPLCTLIRLAAGEFRLALGRWVTIAEDGRGAGAECSRLVSEISSCAKVVGEAVQLMTTLADDESALVNWSPDAILHVRKSLEDALNSSVQFFNRLLSEIHAEGGAVLPSLSEDQCEVGRTCCSIMGTIAAELEVDQLLAPSASTGTEGSQTQSDESNQSSFTYALQGAAIFCNSLGEKQLRDDNLGGHDCRKPIEYHEPLIYLLPCIMSLVSTVVPEGQTEVIPSVREEVRMLCKGGSLLTAISKYLNRASQRWRASVESKQQRSLLIDQMDTILSTLNLCALIIDEVISTANLSEEAARGLRDSLSTWKKILAQASDQCESKVLESKSAVLSQVSLCLLRIEAQEAL